MGEIRVLLKKVLPGSPSVPFTFVPKGVCAHYLFGPFTVGFIGVPSTGGPGMFWAKGDLCANSFSRKFESAYFLRVFTLGPNLWLRLGLSSPNLGL